MPSKLKSGADTEDAPVLYIQKKIRTIHDSAFWSQNAVQLALIKISLETEDHIATRDFIYHFFTIDV